MGNIFQFYLTISCLDYNLYQICSQSKKSIAIIEKHYKKLKINSRESAMFYNKSCCCRFAKRCYPLEPHSTTECLNAIPLLDPFPHKVK